MKKVKVNKYQDHPELENKIVEVTIINNKKMKPIVKNPTIPREPKQPRMTINQLAIEMRAGFAAVNHRMDVEFTAVNRRMDKIDDRIDKIEETLERHEEIFKRNNLK
jgi:hypothetical protein